VKTSGHFEIHGLVPKRWPDLEKLFGKRGACGGCWCMFYRLPRAQWLKQKGPGNKRAFSAVVKSGQVPGLLAYAHGEPVGWCALAPRECYSRLAASRNYKPLDAEPVWSITCFFVARPYRRRGVTLALLKEAVRFAGSRGARIIEGYPSEPKEGWPAVAYYHGFISSFRKAGFKEVARRSPVSPILRRILNRRMRSGKSPKKS